ncbi:MAG: Calcineurin-like phosphoesterase superfamily domain protein [Gemmatimonadetes bacterium]|nr:Calcineurin-like phosphoesterase superfamily domain protein [Gemmatimonadota bacterium]
MRLVHMSDLHLGFRQYEQMTALGVNQREVDVARSFTAAIDQTIALAPELVVIGGDLFHHPRPTNTAIKHAYNGFARLRAALPATEVVMVAGNHDTPRFSASGGIVGLFRHLRMHVVDGAPRVIDLPDLDVSVLAVPDTRVGVSADLRPTGARKYNVLLLHGETGGISPKGTPAADKELTDEDLHVAAWDYIALGHYHVYRECARNTFYCGAIDYTSSDTWGELREEAALGLPGKGIVERDLATGTHTFHGLPRSRDILELESFSAKDATPAQVSAVIAGLVESVPGGIENKVVRLVVTDIERTDVRLLDHALLKAYKRSALSFQLITEAPGKVARAVSMISAAPLTGRKRAKLTDLFRAMFEARELPAEVSREDVIALGLEYLDAVDIGTVDAPAMQVAA